MKLLLPAVLLLAAPLAAAGTDKRGTAAAACNDVVYRSPARNGWEGLPLGNGTFGAQVWQPDGLAMQFNTPLSGAYGGAVARMRLRTAPGMLTGMLDYRQKLSIVDGLLSTEIRTIAGNVAIRCFVPDDTDGLAMEVRDDRSGQVGRAIEIETWRRSALLRLQDGTLLLTDVLHAVPSPPYRYALAAALDRPGPTGGPPALVPADGRFVLYAAFAASRDAAGDPVRDASTKLATMRSAGFDALLARHRARRSAAWNPFYIRLSSPDGTADYVANLWYMHIHAMAAGSRGEVPPKFNGGLWTDDRDAREWGSHYWHWNTQETYWPLYAAGRLDLLEPYHRMYRAMLPTVMAWTKETWETGGAQYQETIPFNGVMGVWAKERGVHPRLPVPASVAHTNLILSSSAEIAMQFWWRYLYTGDETFLREQAWPVMRETARFFENYLEKGPDGRYHVRPSNAHESFWKVKNPATDLAAVRYLFPALSAASGILSVETGSRPAWREIAERIADWPIDGTTGAILPYELRPGEKPEWRNAENPELFPVGVFPLMRLGTPDHGLAVKTFAARRNVNTYGWTTDSICAARLGLADADRNGLSHLLPNHAVSYQNHPSGLMDYYGRRPAIHPYLEGSGTFATAVGEMLLQSWPETGGTTPVIRVCPALPKEWDADFRLLAMGGFEISASARGGKVRTVGILSRRGGRVVLADPFGEPFAVGDGKRTVAETSGPFAAFDTKAGVLYTASPKRPAPPPEPLPCRPNEEPRSLAKTGLMIGKPPLLSRAWTADPAATVEPAQPPYGIKVYPIPQPPAGAQQHPTPVARPPSVPHAASVPDGKLTEERWRAAAHHGPFFTADGRPASQQTQVLLVRDGEALHVGIACAESRMDALQVEYPARVPYADPPVFHDDSVEIFLSPRSGMSWRLAVNAAGARYDGRASSMEESDRVPNPPWTAAVSRSRDGWTAEIVLPFSSFAPEPPADGEEWGFAVIRNERPFGERSSWAPLLPGMPPSRQPGRMLFEGGRAAAPAAAGPPDLVAHWPFDAATGIWLPDRSPNRLFGMICGPVRPAPGKIGGAMDFAGGFVEIAPAPALDLADAFTISAWVKPRGVASARIVDKGPAGGADAYLLDTHPANGVRVITRPATLAASGTRLPAGEWSHVAATFGGGVLRIHVNGAPVAERTGIAGKVSATGLPLRIGADSEAASRFSGAIDDVKIWKRALSSAEIAALARGEE